MEHKTNEHNAYWFIFFNDDLLVNEHGDNIKIPCSGDGDRLNLELTDVQDIGSLDGHKCYVAKLLCTENMPAGFSFKGLKQLYGHIADSYVWFAFRAFHILNWIKNHKYCGCCGSSLHRLSQELALQCLQCSCIVYPRISPAIIVAVIKDQQILLAHSTKFPAGLFSVIAGYVEPGETLEDCVHRELYEEVGIEVTNLKYFDNQPWPFPDSLMLGFTAEYAKGNITVDNVEITEAGWYSAHELPVIPPKGSIARQLIDWFLEEVAGEGQTKSRHISSAAAKG